MSSNAWWAYGSELKIGDDGSVTNYTKVAEIIDIGGPKMSRDTIEVTSQDSADGYREFISGLKDAGEVNVSANWLPAAETHDGSTGVLSKFDGDAVTKWQIITASDGSGGRLTIAFSAIVTNFNVDLPLEEQAKMDFTLKITGKPTFS